MPDTPTATLEEAAELARQIEAQPARWDSEQEKHLALDHITDLQRKYRGAIEHANVIAWANEHAADKARIAELEAKMMTLEAEYNLLLDGDWRDLASVPKAEHEPFLVLRPANDMARFVIEQVSWFGGRMYRDFESGLIDYSDAVTDALMWAPCRVPTKLQNDGGQPSE